MHSITRKGPEGATINTRRLASLVELGSGGVDGLGLLLHAE